MGAWYWLGGKGDGYNQIWLNGTSISNDSSLWSSFQTFRTDVNYCMMLNSARNLDTPLETYIISDSCGYRLCQGNIYSVEIIMFKLITEIQLIEYKFFLCN